MTRIQIAISPEGEVQVSVNGEKGQGCEALTKAIENDLGGTASTERTAEFFERPQRATQTNRLAGRA